MEEIQIDIQKVFKAYEAKMADMMSRIVMLEVENQALREQLAGDDEASVDE